MLNFPGCEISLAIIDHHLCSPLVVLWLSDRRSGRSGANNGLRSQFHSCINNRTLPKNSSSDIICSRLMSLSCRSRSLRFELFQLARRVVSFPSKHVTSNSDPSTVSFTCLHYRFTSGISASFWAGAQSRHVVLMMIVLYSRLQNK